MNSLITMYRDSSMTRYRAISISRYTDIKYLYNQLLRYFITTELDIHVSGYIDIIYLYNQLHSYFITGYLNSYISGYNFKTTSMSNRVKREEQAEVGRTRLFPLALRG